MSRLVQALRSRLLRLLERPEAGLRLSLRLRYGAKSPSGSPDAPWHNAVLTTRDEADAASEQVRRLGLPSMDEPTKNWDGLAALDLILKSTTREARIFDAGGEIYSMILPWLFLYGYRNLIAGNLVFERSRRRGPIEYRHCDITKTGFADRGFDAVTCLSVIEHGVDLEAYFREMSRILLPGGHLITSTDYFDEPVNTRGQTAYGTPIHIFDQTEIQNALDLAARFGLEPTGDLDLTAEERVVHWQRFDLRYTFAVFSLRRTSR